MGAKTSLRIARAVSGVWLFILLSAVIALSVSFGPASGVWQSSPLGGNSLVTTSSGANSLDIPMFVTLFLGWAGLFTGGWLVRGKVELHPDGILVRRFLLSNFYFFRDIEKLRCSEDATGAPFLQLVTKQKQSVVVALAPSQEDEVLDEFVDRARDLMKRQAEPVERPLPTTARTFEFQGARAIVGSDGILVKRPTGDRLLSYHRLATLTPESPKLSLPMGRARWSCSLQSVDGESLVLQSSQSETIHEFICEVRARSDRPDGLPPPELRRGERDPLDWIDTLQRLRQRGGDYREQAFDDEEAERVLEGRGPMVSRVAAAVALGREGDLRLLASNVADRRMRILLEQASEAPDDDLAQAMIEIEELEAEAAQGTWS